MFNMFINGYCILEKKNFFIFSFFIIFLNICYSIDSIIFKDKRIVKINGIEFKLSPTGIKLVRKVTGTFYYCYIKCFNYFFLSLRDLH